MRKYLFIILAAVVLFTSCGTMKVTRIETDETTDLSGKWNDTDSRLVAEELMKDMCMRPWASNFKAVNQKNPAIIVGTVKNKSSEHIEVVPFIKNIEREVLNSGIADIVASAEERESLRAERLDQQEYATEETAKKLAQEYGADFMLQGVVTTITDQISGKSTIYYQVDLELVNIENNKKVWIGNKEIKKYIAKSKYKS